MPVDVGTVVTALLGAGVVSAAVSWGVATRESRDRRAALALEREKWEAERADQSKQRRAERQAPMWQAVYDALNVQPSPLNSLPAIIDWSLNVSSALNPLLLSPEHPVMVHWMDARRASFSYGASAQSGETDMMGGHLAEWSAARMEMQQEILRAIEQLHE